MKRLMALAVAATLCAGCGDWKTWSDGTLKHPSSDSGDNTTTDATGTIRFLNMTTTVDYRTSSTVYFSQKFAFLNLSSTSREFGWTVGCYDRDENRIFSRDLTGTVAGGAVYSDSFSYPGGLAIATFDSISSCRVSNIAVK